MGSIRADDEGDSRVVAESVDGFLLAVRTSGDETVVTVSGELDMATAPELSAALAQLFASSPPKRLVIDAHQMTFVDSTGLSALILGQKRCRATGGELVLRDPAPVLQRLIALAGVERLLPAESDPVEGDPVQGDPI